MPTFYELFRECAQRWPDSIALEIQRRDRVESNTYAEARRMAESIGRWLTENGLQPGARIAILAENHPRWITAYLGIIAAGCAAVPLDTAFHADQVAKLLKDSGSSLLFCDGKHLAVAQKAVEGLSVQILLTDSAELRSAGQPGAAVPKQANLDSIFAAGSGNFVAVSSKDNDLASLLYTSGTTADPKGV